MLTEKQLMKIKEHLEKAQNPIFYYDNDCDGLCSFLILRRYLGRGKGVAVRSFPDLNAQYARKARELNSDYVFVLDKPVIAKEFVEEIAKAGLPLVWIDHHDVNNNLSGEFSNLFIYNPARHKGEEQSNEPVCYWAYKISRKSEDLWLAVAGCIADHYLPDFASVFAKKHPDRFFEMGIAEANMIGTAAGLAFAERHPGRVACGLLINPRPPATARGDHGTALMSNPPKLQQNEAPTRRKTARG